MVTGVTGFVGSHVAKALLERGYRVRGTVRDLEKAAWLVNNVFKDYPDTGRFELCYVRVIAAVDAYDEAIQGVSVVAHVASILTMDPDSTKVIPATVAGATSILNASMKEPSVKSFAYTSSLGAATMLAPAAEKALWKFAGEQRPHFTISSVGPSVIIGEALNKAHNEGDGDWIRTLYDGNTAFWDSMPAIYAVDIKDVAVIHAAALLDPEVTNARLHAWGHKCNANDLLVVMRQHFPEREFIDDLAYQTVLNISADFSEPLALLNKWADQDGWRPLEDSVVENVNSIINLA
ncbi:hypothetical protein TGAMA5MH_10435 [Trichoderma gamsii]|uniref:NAD-dependent epimerase/dehydratase domain-containing protein n=1 Tax=Trichoderma gamsii TaxID=398673 RepID=A0A2K0SWL1_9HYPO|nr:hypothetical protein TGAMA5MH_10435 [Trichoderma gamsii]